LKTQKGFKQNEPNFGLKYLKSESVIKILRFLGGGMPQLRIVRLTSFSKSKVNYLAEKFENDFIRSENHGGTICILRADVPIELIKTEYLMKKDDVKNLCICVFTSLQKNRARNQNENKSKKGLFSPNELQELLVIFVKCNIIYTKVTCILVILLVIFINNTFFTCNLCRGLHIA